MYLPISIWEGIDASFRDRRQQKIQFWIRKCIYFISNDFDENAIPLTGEKNKWKILIHDEGKFVLFVISTYLYAFTNFNTKSVLL